MIKQWIKNNKTESVSILFFILFAIYLWSGLELRTPEYDEIWTLQFYASQPVSSILTDVATPNNHPLNSLMIRYATMFGGYSMGAVRFPAWLSYCGLFVIALIAAIKCFKNSVTRAAFLAWVMLNGVLVHYAETARGYAVQTFFVTALFLSLILYNKYKEQPARRKGYAILFLLTAAGCCLSISSGILYVTFLTGFWWIFTTPFKSGIANIWKEQKPWIISGIIFAIFVLLWYGLHYTEFAKGQAQFGDPMNSPERFFIFISNTLTSLNLWIPLIFTVCGVILLLLKVRKEDLKFCLVPLLALAGMFLSAIITKAGPPRVYLPWVPILCFSAAYTLDQLLEYSRIRKFSPVILLAAIAAAAFSMNSVRQKAADPDLGIAYSNLKENVSPDIYIAYRPTDAFVLSAVFGKDVIEDNLRRMQDPKMIMLFHDNLIGAMRFTDGSTCSFAPTLSTPVQQGSMNDDLGYWIYKLRPPRPGEEWEKSPLVLCRMFGTHHEELRQKQNWLKNNFAVVNAFLTRNLSRLYPAIPSMQFFVSSSPGLSADEMLKLEEDRAGRIRFFILE